MQLSSESERAGKATATLKVTVGEKRVEAKGPLTLPVRTGTTVAIQAPERIEVLAVFEPGEKSGKTTNMPQRFSNWVRNGRLLATVAPLHFRITDDTDLIAFYRDVEKRQEQRRPGKR